VVIQKQERVDEDTADGGRPHGYRGSTKYFANFFCFLLEKSKKMSNFAVGK